MSLLCVPALLFLNSALKNHNTKPIYFHQDTNKDRLFKLHQRRLQSTKIRTAIVGATFTKAEREYAKRGATSNGYNRAKGMTAETEEQTRSLQGLRGLVQCQ